MAQLSSTAGRGTPQWFNYWLRTIPTSSIEAGTQQPPYEIALTADMSRRQVKLAGRALAVRKILAARTAALQGVFLAKAQEISPAAREPEELEAANAAVSQRPKSSPKNGLVFIYQDFTVTQSLRLVFHRIRKSQNLSLAKSRSALDSTSWLRTFSHIQNCVTSVCNDGLGAGNMDKPKPSALGFRHPPFGQLSA
jgi:hypothetical protein